MAEKNKPKTPSHPNPALKKLEGLVGKWVTELQLKQEPESPFRIIGTDTYKWLAGGFFLLHEVDVVMNEEPYRATELIGGYDTTTDSYPMRSFDSQGTFQTMQATLNDVGVWTFAGDTTRATLTISDDGTHMTADWEQIDDKSKWQPWMKMKFTKIR